MVWLSFPFCGNEGEAIYPNEDPRDAWNNQAGLSKTEAKRQYITTLIEVCGPLLVFLA